MSPSPPVSARRAARDRPGLARLLRDLGPALQRGGAAGETRPPLATGLVPLDALLGGGLAPGRLCELCGPPSSGRTSLALALLARATAEGEVVAVVDPGDALHPASARAAGVRLERVLWARPPDPAAALRCCERLLATRGFALVWLDTGDRPAAWAALGAAAGQRLARAAAAGGAALLVSSAQRVTGPHAEVALALGPARARFGGGPTLFDGLDSEATVSRRRRGAAGGRAALCWRAADLG